MHLLDAFGAAGADPSTPDGAKRVLVAIFQGAAARAPADAVRLRAIADQLAGAVGLSAGQIYDVAFDQAAVLASPSSTRALVNQITALRDASVRDGQGVLQSPPADFSAPASWWARRYAAVMLADANADRPVYDQALLKTAAALIGAPAWRDGVVTRARVLVLLRWLLSPQSGLPAGAGFTRAFLARELSIVNYDAPSTWATVAPVLATPWTAASSALDWVKANPGKTEGGIGGLLLIGGLAAGAVFARELRGLVGEGRGAVSAAWSAAKER